MKKQTINNFPATTQHKIQVKQNSKNPGNRIAKYIYTEEDLGEGVLYIGLNLTLTRGKKQFNPQNN